MALSGRTSKVENMSQIQGKDVKSVSELEALGGGKSDLTPDSKIYITAKGIKKTLAEAIESGEIADGNRFGADVKNFAYTFTDGSQEEHNTDVPFVNSNGNTQINLTFEIKDYEVAQLYVNGKYFSKYISDAVSPNDWWKIVNDNAIEIKGDLTNEAWPVNFIIFRGSEIPVVPSVFSGLKIENEAFGYTDQQTGDNVVSVLESNGTTIFTFSFDMLAHDVPFLFIDNEFYPQWSASNQTGKWYKKINSNQLQIGTDLTGTHTPFYVAVFQGKSFIDNFGNMVVTLKPEIASFILQSPNGDKFNVACSVAGELETETIQTSEPADLILFKRDDGEILELTIDDDGHFEAVEQTQAGILFETIYLSDIDGLVWDLGALDDNTLYTTQHGKNFFQLLRPNGNVLKQFTAMADNAVYESTGYIEEEKLESVDSEPNETITTTTVRRQDGSFSLFKWNTLSQKWEDWLFKIATPFGVSVNFYGKKEKIPYAFALANGDFLLKSSHIDLFDIIGTRYGESGDKLSFRLPDLRSVVERGVDDGRGLDPDVATRRKAIGALEDDDMVGSYQDDELKAHDHYYSRPATIQRWWGSTWGWDYDSQASARTGMTGGNETRMKNMYSYKIMRVK